MTSSVRERGQWCWLHKEKFSDLIQINWLTADENFMVEDNGMDNGRYKH